MGRLSKPNLIEAAVWFAIAAIFFGYTFEFNQPIEIYKFGATAWPRVSSCCCSWRQPATFTINMCTDRRLSRAVLA